MAKNYLYKEPFLSKPANDNLEKQWVVEYGVWSGQQEKIVPKRVTISGPTVEERLKDANEGLRFY